MKKSEELKNLKILNYNRYKIKLTFLFCLARVLYI